MADTDMSRSARSLLLAYRDHERPDMEVARRSWRSVRERVSHPEADAREAWALRLPEVEESYGDDEWLYESEYRDEDLHEDLYDDLHDGLAEPASAGLFHYVKAVGTSIAIAAAVLLGARVVVLSASTMTQEAREAALEAPYHGRVNRDEGRASVKEPKPLRAAARGKTHQPTSTAVPNPEMTESDAVGAAVVPEPAVVAEPAGAIASKRRRGKPSKAKPAATQVDDIAAELSLVTEATQAKNRGDTDQALALLSKHAQRFPVGALSQERQALRAEVHCARGQRSQARALADRFVAKHPKSALLGRMNGVCVD